jgi:hypothetical protein
LRTDPIRCAGKDPNQARPTVAAYGGRATLVAGDFFVAVPPGGDVYLLRHILHDWDDDRAVRILANCRRAMGPAGRLLLIETVLRPDGGPALGTFLDLVMLVMTGGRERTELEYGAVLAAAGFRLVRVVSTPADVDVLEAVPFDGESP